MGMEVLRAALALVPHCCERRQVDFIRNALDAANRGTGSRASGASLSLGYAGAPAEIEPPAGALYFIIFECGRHDRTSDVRIEEVKLEAHFESRW